MGALFLGWNITLNKIGPGSEDESHKRDAVDDPKTDICDDPSQSQGSIEGIERTPEPAF